jgi:hypothetical protein
MIYDKQDFEDIRPYSDEEINPALKRIIAVPEFKKILDFLFPEKNKEEILTGLGNIHSAIEFQKQFMYPLVYSIVDKTSKGLTTDGFEKLPTGVPYLFVGNHRDIVLDSAILQVVLVDHGHSTSEITFGSNLMTNQFIIDLGKVNRMFKVSRGGNRMELFRNSKILSSYIRYTISEKKTSAWIAQRNGRTKDGSDRTETGLLKMFNISGSCDFIESFSELNIVPLAVSYEYEPCCAFKIREISAGIKGVPYQKQANEDLLSIVTGITGQKGHIHLAACTPINMLLPKIDQQLPLNEKVNQLASLIDLAIYEQYKLWPGNYIAFDMINNSSKHTEKYSPHDVAEFKAYMKKELSIFSGDISLQEELLLKMYANPVINRLQ